jgi:predicted house-cleaning noncanonical NTP pyrophosphatase (MazG superfamily)
MTDKLVRDDIPDIIRENGEVPKTHTADDEEYMERLCGKLLEEAEEYKESQDVEELADLMEVILSIRSLDDISRNQIERKRRRKRKERGGFENRIVLDEVHTECEYCSTVSSDVEDREIVDNTPVNLCSDCFIKYRTELRNSRMHL